MASVLIVDDVPDSCETVEVFLKKLGHDVRCVPNGREALREVLDRTPDAVILDLHMPVMDGPTFLEVVRSYLRLQALPVIVLTALTDSPLIERARAMGADTILQKSKATLEEIGRAVDDAIGRGSTPH